MAKPSRYEQLVANRRAKLDEWRAAGAAYPNDFRPDALAKQLHGRFADTDKAALEELVPEVRVAGRLTAKRKMGRVSFGQILDRSGVALQIYLRRDDLGDDAYAAFKRLDVGDIVGVTGVVMRTDAGELSVQAASTRLLVKGLVPPPEKWHGLTDVEARYRQRHIDLTVNPEVRGVFEARAAVIRHIRRFLDDQGFIEVETPTLQPLYGGANARPFVTHHNTYDTALYLRIATELYLKRLVAGGIERVYEIGKNFRNEGVDTQHNPEFTAIEFYQAYATFTDLMDLTEAMICGVAQELHGGTMVPYQGVDVQWATPWRRLTAREAVLSSPEVQETDLADRASLAALLRLHGHKVPEHCGYGGLLMEAFDAFAEHTLVQPTFVTHYPTEVSPLSRPSAGDGDVVDRFELFVCGREIANAFSELNDPDDQRARFEAQDKAKALGDAEAHPIDEEFLAALQWGMPPTAGEGIGIDRLVMLMTDSASIRDVLLFPLLRPTGQPAESGSPADSAEPPDPAEPGSGPPAPHSPLEPGGAGPARP